MFFVVWIVVFGCVLKGANAGAAAGAASESSESIVKARPFDGKGASASGPGPRRRHGTFNANVQIPTWTFDQDNFEPDPTRPDLTYRQEARAMPTRDDSVRVETDTVAL